MQNIAVSLFKDSCKFLWIYMSYKNQILHMYKYFSAKTIEKLDFTWSRFVNMLRNHIWMAFGAG